MLSEAEGNECVARALALGAAEEVQVQLTAREGMHLRFARNTPSTSGALSDHELTVRSAFGRRSASATTNQLDPDSLREVVARSEALARLAPENPEWMPDLGPQSFPVVSAFDPGLVTEGPAQLVKGTGLAIDAARSAGLIAAGFSEAIARATWIGNRRGLSAYHRSTEAGFSTTVRTPAGDGSGWAAGSGNSVRDIDHGRVVATAIEKARHSVGPTALEPGKYVTVLEPACVASLMQLLLFSLNQRRADEGRSFFSQPGGKTKLGQQLFSEQVTIASDPSRAQAPGVPFSEDGQPQLPRMWIDRGRLAQLACERFWAQTHQREPVPPPSNLLMSGGLGSLEDLIASTKRGVLITSLWYIRSVDPRRLSFTGLTRDGVFWIEDGKIRHPLPNFRWNDSPISVLENVEAMSESVRASPRDGTATNLWVPALRVKEFELSSVSDAV
jgi:predicted Zn-dependent protease